MQSMHTSGMRCAEPSVDSAHAALGGGASARRSWAARCAVIVLAIVMTGLLPACSGSGGDNGSANPRSDVTPMGLTFSYPFNGQQDVVLDSQIVVDFAGDITGSMDDALELQVDGQTAQPAITVQQDDNQANILRLIPNGDLLPNTSYKVVATRTLSSGATGFDAGQTLFQFTTRPAEGRPATDGFKVSEVTPGETNPVTGETTLFTQFNAIRVVLSEPVDASTVNGDSFSVTGPDGTVTDARVTALGRYITFDPIEDLAPGQYTVAWTDAITSQFGNTLAAGNATRTVLSTGQTATENLRIEPNATDVADLPDNNLNGTAVNNVNISSQLIGSNDQPASAAPPRTGVLTTLAQPGLPGYGDVFPAVIRSGQKFQLTGLKLFLNGDFSTPINPSGPIDVNFVNDVSVYLKANDYRNIESPTAVRLRFDLGIGTLITAAAGSQQSIIQSLANGVFNQSVLNIQAAGLAIPQDNGDLRISSLGTFPINVNRTDNATVNFQLTFTLPGGDQTPVQADEIAPIITAQSPSACLYAFGSPGYNGFYAGAAPTAFPEVFCTLPLNGQQPPTGGLGLSINSFPIESSPAITFSEPLDPTSVNGQSIQLTGNGTTVPATYRVEGFSVVVDPAELLAPSTQYQITLNAGATLKDLAGNAVTFDNSFGPGQTITFTTEPQSVQNPTAPLLGTLTPGVPCALAGGDFTTGGDNAGNCAGGADNGSAPDYPVFQNPANVAVDGIFSKLVDTTSIVLADGCLTSGGNANTVANATVAVQEMDGGGQCVDAVPGALAFSNTGDALTRAFTFRPSADFQPGTRYWIVVCGTQASACTNTIVDGEGSTLNTNPIAGTGSTLLAGNAAGGPDIVMPFDAIAPDGDYYTSQFTLPETDTNGNGQADDDEVPQPGNRALVNLAASLGGAALPINNPDRPDGAYPSYLALARPIALRKTLDDCSAVDTIVFDDGSTPAAGAMPDECIQVSLLPGGINSLTSINLGLDAVGGLANGLLGSVSDTSQPLSVVPLIGETLQGALGGTFTSVGALLGDTTGALGNVLGGLLGGSPLEGAANPIRTGRILLRFPNAADETGVAGQPTQSGYIVEKCSGTFPNGLAYDFEPCFVASLHLVANAPDGQLVNLDQQAFTANIVGPVTFEQNGRLVISVRNVNTITLNAAVALDPLPGVPATATINPTNLNFQLVGNATHGGRAFPNR